MRLIEKSFLIAWLAFVGATLPTRAAEPQASPAAVGKAVVEKTADDSKPLPIDIPIPVGEPVSGIKIPQYDEEGKLSMTLLAGTAKKLDDRNVELNKLKVSFIDKEGKETIVEIPHARLDTESKMLTADSRTVVTREDFDIAGEKAEFDTVARTGRFKGRVRASFRNETSPAQP